MADRIITVTDPSVVTNDTLAGYNNYSDQDGQLGTTMTPTEATNGHTVALSDGVVHEVTTKPVGTTNGEFSAVVSNAVTVDLSSSYDTDYQAVLTYASGQGYTLPSSGQQDIQNQLVLDLKSNGIWAERDVFYLPANDGSEEFGRINWKSPSSFELTKVGTVAWTSNVGYKGDNTTGYHNMNWDRLNDAVNFQASDASGCMWVVTAQTGTDPKFYFGGRVDNATNQFQMYKSNTTMTARGNSSNSFSAAGRGADTGMCCLLDRVGGTYLNEYWNGGIYVHGFDTTQALPMADVDMYVGALNDNGTADYFSNVEWGFLSFGSAMPTLQGTLNTLISTYMSAI